jgi:hypothetical protein
MKKHLKESFVSALCVAGGVGGLSCLQMAFQGNVTALIAAMVIFATFVFFFLRNTRFIMIHDPKKTRDGDESKN